MMRSRIRVWQTAGLLVAAVLTLGCGHTLKVRPTAHHQVDAEFEVGGPLAQVGSRVLPVPLTTVGASYGAFERGDVSAHLHPTAALFGVAGADVGGSWLALAEQGAVPAVAISGRLYGFSDFRTGARGYLELGVAGSYEWGRRVTTYLGANGLMQTGGPLLWALAGGAELKLGRTTLGAELRWYEPEYNTRFVVVDWLTPTGRGGLGVVLGARVHFGGPDGTQTSPTTEGSIR